VADKKRVFRSHRPVKQGAHIVFSEKGVAGSVGEGAWEGGRRDFTGPGSGDRGKREGRYYVKITASVQEVARKLGIVVLGDIDENQKLRGRRDLSQRNPAWG